MEKDSRGLYLTKSQQCGQKASPFQESWKGGQCLGHSTYHPEAGSVILRSKSSKYSDINYAHLFFVFLYIKDM